MRVGHDLLAIGSGSIVGFTLGLVGGGGSIMAVPLLVYVVGVASPWPPSIAVVIYPGIREPWYWSCGFPSAAETTPSVS